MAKERADKLLVERGLAENRTRARAMILAGEVFIRDRRIEKPGQMIDPSAEITIKGPTPQYVSRGGVKLEAALGQFQVDPSGKTCIDIGASTGGFTDCLLKHGAARVWAVDVGRGQLAWKLRQDPRVVVMEGVNARSITPDIFPTTFDLATVDVSFISLKLVLPPLRSVLKPGSDIIALIKPQFEVGRGEVGRGGIVSDPAKHERVLSQIATFSASIGLKPKQLARSPILGADGNREFFIHLENSPGDVDPSLIEKISTLARSL
jgi:23S rRNA (cytidine1920-2'-O)/16S rRNA (cytidine1409-2'-O)-methyltransferase